MNIALICAFDSLGDHLVNIKALYALKMLYPNDRVLFIIKKHFARAFETCAFIDEIHFIDDLIAMGGGLLNLQKLDIDILLLGRSYKDDFIIKAAKNALAKRIIAPFHLKTFFDKQVQSFFYLQGHKCLESYKLLKAVRAINKKHYDAHISDIDFLKAHLQTLGENKAFVDEFCQKHKFKSYKKVIGLNPFGFSNPNFKFEIKDWVGLGEILAKIYPEALFVMMNYEANSYHYEPFTQDNLKAFVNNDDLLNLVEFTSRLNLLISVDTGNVHIADNLNKPILEVIKRRKISFQWCGGSYGNECESVKLPNGWKKHYERHKNKFYTKAIRRVDRLLRE